MTYGMSTIQATSNTTTWGNTYYLPVNGQQIHVYPQPTPPPPVKKEIPMVAGAAPIKTLHTRYAQVKGGYVGQVVYGDPERTSSEGVIAWESLPFPFGEDHDSDYAGAAKDAALKAAQGALDKAFLSMFDGIPAAGPKPKKATAKRA